MSNADDTEEFELARRWAEGDRAAGHLIVASYYDRLRRFFISNIRDKDVREDLIQETFLKLQTGIRTFKGAGPLRAFVFTIATRTLYDEFRRRYKEDFVNPLESSLADMDAETPTKRMAEIERRHQLMGCIRKLPVELKQLLELRYWQELPTAELADIFEINVVTVRGRLFSIRKRLRACLKRAEVTPPTQVALDAAAAPEGDADLEDVDPALVSEIREIGRLVAEMS